MSLKISRVLKWILLATILFVCFHFLKSKEDALSSVTQTFQAHSYKNSLNLVEKLRPKLVTENSEDENQKPLWNNLNVARNKVNLLYIQ